MSSNDQTKQNKIKAKNKYGYFRSRISRAPMMTSALIGAQFLVMQLLFAFFLALGGIPRALPLGSNHEDWYLFKTTYSKSLVYQCNVACIK